MLSQFPWAEEYLRSRRSQHKATSHDDILATAIDEEEEEDFIDRSWNQILHQYHQLQNCTEVGRDFFLRWQTSQGWGRNTSDHPYVLVATEPRNVSRIVCRQYDMRQSQTFVFRRLGGGHNAVVMARHWCMIMQHFFTFSNQCFQ